MDSTVEAASSHKNRTGARDLEMHQTRKGNQWHFGVKAHIGLDAGMGVVHSMMTMAGNAHDVTQARKLLHRREGGVGRCRVSGSAQAGGEPGSVSVIAAGVAVRAGQPADEGKSAGGLMRNCCESPVVSGPIKPPTPRSGAKPEGVECRLASPRPQFSSLNATPPNTLQPQTASFRGYLNRGGARLSYSSGAALSLHSRAGRNRTHEPASQRAPGPG